MAVTPQSDPFAVGDEALLLRQRAGVPVFVARQRITGDPRISPDAPLELRVEFTRMGKKGTLVRMIQGPYDPDITDDHSTGRVAELDRLNALLRANATPIEGAGR